MKRSASAYWRGDLKAGKGQISTESGVLDQTPYSFSTRFESGKGTNPEELVAAAHAGCFTMALSAELGKLGMTPDAIRRKNFIPPKAMPYTTATGKVYDSGDFTAHMKRAMEVANWKEFPKRAKAAKKQGLVRGIGMASYVEVCGTMGEETANVALDPNGDISILIGTQLSGQGHQTAYAQLVAEQFGVPPERVHVLQGDTDKIASGLGTGGSASIPTGGVSVERDEEAD